MATGTPYEPPLQQVITDLFRDFKGDEIGGRHAIRGFSFQVWHAVLEAFRAHCSGGDYAVVLEWQQDVAVLDSSASPKQVKFIQLKKNESSLHWTLKALIAPEKVAVAAKAAANNTALADASVTEASAEVEQGAAATGKKAKGKGKSKAASAAQGGWKPSVLAKLYGHRRRFKACDRVRLEFTSDADFKVPSKTGTDDTVSHVELAALAPSVVEDLTKQLREQLQVDEAEEIDLADFALRVSDCPVNEPHKYLAGELAEMQMGGTLHMSGQATLLAVLVIASYVNLRAGQKKFATTFDELLARAVTRTDIDTFLAAANDHAIPTQDHVQTVVDRLNAEQAPFRLVREMRGEVTRACVDITNRAGLTPLVAAKLKALYEDNHEYADAASLTTLLDAWYEDYQQVAGLDAAPYKRGYVYCLMAMIYEDANPIQHLPSVPAGPQSKDGQ